MAGEFGFDTGPFVNAATFCEGVETGKDGCLTLFRLINQVTITLSGPNPPDNIPQGTIVRTLVVCLKAGKALGAQRFRLRTEYPDGSVREGPAGSATFPAGEGGGINLIVEVPIEVTSAGLYWEVVSINDRDVARVPLDVVYNTMQTQ